MSDKYDVYEIMKFVNNEPTFVCSLENICVGKTYKEASGYVDIISSPYGYRLMYCIKIGDDVTELDPDTRDIVQSMIDKGVVYGSPIIEANTLMYDVVEHVLIGIQNIIMSLSYFDIIEIKDVATHVATIVSKLHILDSIADSKSVMFKKVTHSDEFENALKYSGYEYFISNNTIYIKEEL